MSKSRTPTEVEAVTLIPLDEGLEDLEATYMQIEIIRGDDAKIQSENHRKPGQTGRHHVCDVCTKQFAKASNLYRHIRNIHEVEVSLPRNKLLCPLCTYDCNFIWTLRKHCKETHETKLKQESLTFVSKDDFLAWKATIEAETRATFVKHTGSKKYEGIEYCYYQCHRSGHFKSQGKGKRNLKIQGSNKINATCPAGIKVQKQSNGRLRIEFFKTHLGHVCPANEITLTRPRLSLKEKKAIGEKLAYHTKIDKLLIDIHTAMGIPTNNEDDSNDPFGDFPDVNATVTSKDKLKFDEWIDSLGQLSPSPVRLYKKQRENLSDYPELNLSDFALVLMNEAQKCMLELYGNGVVCVDSSQGTRGYEYQLVTVLVLDGKKEGFPVVFIVTNNIMEPVMTAVFRSIRKSVDQISPIVFTSDITDIFYDAWNSAFGKSAERKRLLSSWQVDREWRKKLSLIPKQEKQAEVYKVCRNLLQETVEVRFTKLLQQSVAQWSKDESVSQFRDYFVDNYAKHPELWAYCYREWCGLSTNLHIEKIHRTVKYFYMESKKLKGLDKTLLGLMKFIRDNCSDSLLAVTSSNNYQSFQRHVESLSLETDSILECEVNDEDFQQLWVVKSIVNCRLYCVQRHKDCSRRNACILFCNECNACAHNFTCSCFDNAVQWHMCKHIHLVARVTKVMDTVNTPAAVSTISLQHDHGYFTLSARSNQTEPDSAVDNCAIKGSRKDVNSSVQHFRKRIKSCAEELIAYSENCDSVERLQKLDQQLTLCRTLVDL